MEKFYDSLYFHSIVTKKNPKQTEELHAVSSVSGS